MPSNCRGCCSEARSLDNSSIRCSNLLLWTHSEMSWLAQSIESIYEKLDNLETLIVEDSRFIIRLVRDGQIKPLPFLTNSIRKLSDRRVLILRFISRWALNVFNPYSPNSVRLTFHISLVLRSLCLFSPLSHSLQVFTKSPTRKTPIASLYRPTFGSRSSAT